MPFETSFTNLPTDKGFYFSLVYLAKLQGAILSGTPSFHTGFSECSSFLCGLQFRSKVYYKIVLLSTSWLLCIWHSLSTTQFLLRMGVIFVIALPGEAAGKTLGFLRSVHVTLRQMEYSCSSFRILRHKNFTWLTSPFPSMLHWYLAFSTDSTQESKNQRQTL